MSDDTPMVPVHYPAANGKADAGPLILCAAMQTLKDGKDLVEVLFVETDTIVLDAQLAQRLAGNGVQHPRCHLNARSTARRLKLQRVADQVQQELPHLHGVSLDGRQ